MDKNPYRAPRAERCATIKRGRSRGQVVAIGAFLPSRWRRPLIISRTDGRDRRPARPHSFQTLPIVWVSRK
jgi:hypothetical protein